MSGPQRVGRGAGSLLARLRAPAQRDMATPYAGKVAVITGASAGLGAGMAKEFRRLGLSVGLCSRSPACLADEPEGSVVAAQLDIRDEKAVADFADLVVSRLGKIDLWVNNAGVLDPISFVRDLDASAFQEHLNTNVVGVLNGTRSFVRHLRCRGGDGVLVNISSGAARSGYAGWGAYCASKAAVDLLTECTQIEEKDSGLRAYSLAPGIIDTAMQERIRGLSAEEFPMVEKFHTVKKNDAFNTPEFVARHILDISFDPNARPDKVACSAPKEKQ